ncbi:MAG: DUF547 domain-containing protein [Candidatus Heimdallarchaeota archaeon]|nr:DUF547 domain-containing protein [Candidatus Heimdallarchaeota archaeon]
MAIRKSREISNPVISKWINHKGKVDYLLLKKDQWFWEQIFALENANLRKYTRNEKLAFWLNTYNLLTIKGVLIELDKNPKWKGNVTVLAKLRFFILRKFLVAGKKLSLNYIEKNIIRRRFKDPRVHFALNCGSASCPFLPNKLFQAESLDKYLDNLTKFFINSGNVRIDEETRTVYLSRIFKWYKRDFAVVGGLEQFINKYWKKNVIDFTKYLIKFEDYDWSLNKQ